MKKTLITLLALACPAVMAITEEDALTKLIDSKVSIESGTQDISFGHKYATMTIVLDVDAFHTLYSTVTSANRPIIATLADAGNHVYGAQLGENSTANRFLLAATNSGNHFGDWIGISVVDWNRVDGAVLTMASWNNNNSATGGTRMTFSYTLEGDTELHSTEILNGGLRYEAGGNIKAASFNTDIVKYVCIMDEYYHGEDAVTLNKAALQLPEPATATLSLLALAGLCARRRR